MTAEQMPAGREMDALVAERVFGWEWFEVGDTKHTRMLRPADRFTYGAIADRDGVKYLSGLPRYSTDVSDAWLVVEHITRPPATLKEAERAANTRFGFWWDKANLWAYEAPEAAAAICRAALEAVGGAT